MLFRRLVMRFESRGTNSRTQLSMHCFTQTRRVAQHCEINQSDNDGENRARESYESLHQSDLRQKRIKKPFKLRLGIYSLAFTVTLVAVDKVDVDFIVHSFITTELCFYEHYLYAPASRSVSRSALGSWLEIYCSSLWNCLCAKPEIVREKLFFVEDYQKLMIYSNARLIIAHI